MRRFYVTLPDRAAKVALDLHLQGKRAPKLVDIGEVIYGFRPGKHSGSVEDLRKAFPQVRRILEERRYPVCLVGGYYYRREALKARHEDKLPRRGFPADGIYFADGYDDPLYLAALHHIGDTGVGVLDKFIEKVHHGKFTKDGLRKLANKHGTSLKRVTQLMLEWMEEEELTKLLEYETEEN